MGRRGRRDLGKAARRLPGDARRTALTAPLTWADRGYRLGRLVLSLLFRATGGLIVRGAARIPPDGPLIIVANHASVVDGLILVAACPRRMVSLSAAYLFTRPGVGALLRWFGAIPVEGGTGATAGMKRALSHLGAGGALMVFPEGGVGRQPRPFAPGWAYLALKAGAAVLPVGIRGSGRLLPPGEWRPHRARVEVCIDEPLRLSSMARPPRTAMAALNVMMEERVRDLCAGRHGPSPTGR
ncbi:MAG: lysophospholipid acyltransferase family protein [Bacillota bacterium]|nr:lysophospholipid acyltransferase family protein [Bacillota bacterium]